MNRKRQVLSRQAPLGSSCRLAAESPWATFCPNNLEEAPGSTLGVVGSPALEGECRRVARLGHSAEASEVLDVRRNVRREWAQQFPLADHPRPKSQDRRGVLGGWLVRR